MSRTQVRPAESSWEPAQVDSMVEIKRSDLGSQDALAGNMVLVPIYLKWFESANAKSSLDAFDIRRRGRDPFLLLPW